MQDRRALLLCLRAPGGDGRRSRPPAVGSAPFSGFAAREDHGPSVSGVRVATMTFERLKVVPRDGPIAVPEAAVLAAKAHRDS